MKFATVLAQRFHPVLKLSGFRKTGQHWHNANDEIVQVVNIQQSRWGNWSYVNCGLHLKQVGTSGMPKEYECEIRFRLEHVTSGELGKLVGGELHDLLSENPKQPNESDAAKITEALERYGIPFLAQFENFEKIRKLTRFAFLRKSMTTNFARTLLAKKTNKQMVSK